MMKKVSKLLLLFVVQAFVSLNIFGQTIDPNHPESITSSQVALPQTVSCDRALGKVGLDPVGGTSLTSTRNFGWTAPNTTIDIECATEIRIPQLATSGKQVIQRINFSGANGGATNGLVSLWTDAGNVPGTKLYENAAPIADSNFLWDCTLQANNLIQPGVTYWISPIAIADGTTLGQRWFWTPSSAALTSAAGYQQYAVYYRSVSFGNCPYWTTHTACGGAFQIPGTAMSWSADICANSFLTLGGTPVPTMTQWGLFLFGLVLLTLAVVTVYNFSRKNVTITK